MPTTPNGTAYTVHIVDLGVHGTMYWYVADAVAGSSNIPAIMYLHGADGPANQFLTAPGWAPLRNERLDAGWLIFEGTGGGAHNWGNLPGRAAYMAYLEHMLSILSIGDIILLGRSAGGLLALWLYVKSAVASRFSGLILNSAVSTLFTGNTTAPSSGTVPPQIERSTGRFFTTNQWSAWGAADYAGWAAAVTAADAAPESWAASVWAGKNILSLYGTADTTVPWNPRGGQPLRTLWAGQPTIDDVYERVGGDHSQGNGSYLDVFPMVSFLSTVTGGTPPEPPSGEALRVVAEWEIFTAERRQIRNKVFL